MLLLLLFDILRKIDADHSNSDEPQKRMILSSYIRIAFYKLSAHNVVHSFSHAFHVLVYIYAFLTIVVRLPWFGDSSVL